MSKSLAILTALAAAGIGTAPVKADCRRIAGDRILGSDLALADARFAALPPSLMLAFAPDPGTKRTFTPGDLARIARTNGIPVGNFEEICFQPPMARLNEEDVLAAMRRSLPPDARLRIVEVSKSDVPVGDPEFRPENLEPPTPGSPTVQLWRGSIKYGPSRRFDIWARVEVTAPVRVIVPSADLRPGVPIHQSSLDVEVRQLPIYGEKPLSSLDAVTGKQPRHFIKAGSPIAHADLVDPPVVRKGDVVAVRVESGTAHLRFEAVAEGPARAGETVDLRNPINGKAFKARVEAGATALIVVPERPAP